MASLEFPTDRADRVAARSRQYVREELDGGFREKGLVNLPRGLGVLDVKEVDEATHSPHCHGQGGGGASQNCRLLKIKPQMLNFTVPKQTHTHTHTHTHT